MRQRRQRNNHDMTTATGFGTRLRKSGLVEKLTAETAEANRRPQRGLTINASRLVMDSIRVSLAGAPFWDLTREAVGR